MTETVALTPDMREQLKDELHAFNEMRAPLKAFIAPIEKAIRSIDEMEGAVLERYGIYGEVTTCEHCEVLIVPGDNYAHYEDGPTHCEACAPTYQDSLDQQREIAADETADPDNRAEAAEAVKRLEAMTPEELMRKILLVWE